MSKKKTIGALLAGTAIGLGAGVLLAPKSGAETRKDIKEKAQRTAQKLKHHKKEDKPDAKKENPNVA